MSETTIIRESPLTIPTIMKAHWNAKEPFHLIGEPSTVKSALIKQTSKVIAERENKTFVEWSKLSLEKKKEINKEPEKYFIFEDLRASETDIGELRLQEMNNGENYITYKYSILFDTISQPEVTGVLFFDEMNLASNMIKAQFYKVYNDRSIGDLPLSNKILVCSAGNESSQVRDVIQDSVALVTRRGNYFINPITSDEFIEYGINTGINSTILGYLAFAPDDVHKLDYEISDSLGQPCVRTWEKLSNIYNSNKELNINGKSLFARGLIGQATSTKFIAFVKLETKIKLEDIILDPSKIEKIEELQIVYSIITGLLGKYKEGDKKIFGTILEVSTYIKEEMGIYMLRMLIKVVSHNKFKKLISTEYAKEFDACYKKYGDLLLD